MRSSDWKGAMDRQAYLAVLGALKPGVGVRRLQCSGKNEQQRAA